MERVDAFQFMEELLGSFLFLQNVNYKPVGLYTGEINLKNWPALLYCVGHIYDDILKRHLGHLTDILQMLGIHGNCNDYVGLLGKCLFEGEEFSWALFKEFLALICALSSVAYRARITFLSDDIVITGAMYIRNRLHPCMESCWGWQGLEQHCVLIVLKMEEAKRQGMASHRGETGTHDAGGSSTNPKTVLLVKRPICCTYANQTGGRAFELEFCDPEFPLASNVKKCNDESEIRHSKSGSGRDSVSSVSSVSSFGDEPVTNSKDVFDDRRCPLALHVVTNSMSALAILRDVI